MLVLHTMRYCAGSKLGEVPIPVIWVPRQTSARYGLVNKPVLYQYRASTSCDLPAILPLVILPVASRHPASTVPVPCQCHLMNLRLLLILLKHYCALVTNCAKTHLRLHLLLNYFNGQRQVLYLKSVFKECIRCNYL